ncbi:hypothetical protein COL5a_008859 [Colletotrichum fioriniae]|nr:hypothetical protein COL5a_008859 [Colletotrichum fioriniae]
MEEQWELYFLTSTAAVSPTRKSYLGFRVRSVGKKSLQLLEVDAMAAVSICKYPPQGKRSITGQLPAFSLKAVPQSTIILETNANGSTVFLMIETKESIENIDEIASVEGADVLLVGSNDLAIELGAPSQFQSPVFREAMEIVSRACKKHGKIMGLAGIYNNHGLHDWAINELGVRFLLGGQDSAILARGATETMAEIAKVQK